MTAATTVFALLPTAIGIGDTGSANVPLAIAVIGGTITATLLTLYIIPIFYLMIAKN
jgi:HAE1 family hydrophobic/amphiphilic exporter-1